MCMSTRRIVQGANAAIISLTLWAVGPDSCLLAQDERFIFSRPALRWRHRRQSGHRGQEAPFVGVARNGIGQNGTCSSPPHFCAGHLVPLYACPIPCSSASARSQPQSHAARSRIDALNSGMFLPVSSGGRSYGLLVLPRPSTRALRPSRTASRGRGRLAMGYRSPDSDRRTP